MPPPAITTFLRDLAARPISAVLAIRDVPTTEPKTSRLVMRLPDDPTTTGMASRTLELHMILGRRLFLQLSSSSVAFSLLPSPLPETGDRTPIIDVHLHAYPDDMP